MHRRRLLGLLFVAAALMLVAHARDGDGPRPGGPHRLCRSPKWLFGWGAAVVLIVSFVGARGPLAQAALRAPRPSAAWPRVPSCLDPLCGAIGLALFALVVYAGLRGLADETDNLMPTFVYVRLLGRPRPALRCSSATSSPR